MFTLWDMGSNLKPTRNYESVFLRRSILSLFAKFDVLFTSSHSLEYYKKIKYLTLFSMIGWGIYQQEKFFIHLSKLLERHLPFPRAENHNFIGRYLLRTISKAAG